MTTTQPVNPVEVARIALKRLSERGLPPTPENYAQFYNAIVTIKSPENKNSVELQNAWQILVKLDDAVSDAHDTTKDLVTVLVTGGQRMSGSLGALQEAKQAHDDKRMSVEEAHSALESLLTELIDSTSDIHTSVTTSTDDLRAIRDAVKNIEEDLAFNRKMLEQDALTGALNRQGFDHLLSTEVKRAQRHATNLAVVMFDLDDFKLINDRYGHLTGDQVLIHITNLTKAVLRESDLLVRYGGEEFLLLLPETDIHGARYVIDRLRTVAQRTPFMNKSQRIDINFSTGIATLKAEENGRALVLRADEALYRAKHNGRGCVEMAE